jgi:hypothetical protein
MKIHEYCIELFKTDPVITEYEAYRLLKSDPLIQEVNYLAVPWASLINQGKINSIAIKPIKGGFTICQHTGYKWIIPALLEIGVEVLFAPHVDENHRDIKVFPFPHYAINGINPTKEKDIWYSFIGLDSTSKINSNLRRNIFKIKHPKSAVVKKRKHWHWARENNWSNLSEVQQKKEKIEYMDILARSRFSLCPRGFGASTLRFWESLKAGAIPVLLSDTMRLPGGIDWGQCIIRLREDEVGKIPGVLSTISIEEEHAMREACLKAYRNFSEDNFVKCIRDYLNETI